MTQTTLPVTLEDYKRIEYNCVGMVPGERDYMIQLWIDYVDMMKGDNTTEKFRKRRESFRESIDTFLAISYAIYMRGNFRLRVFDERDNPESIRDLRCNKDNLPKHVNRPIFSPTLSITNYMPRPT